MKEILANSLIYISGGLWTIEVIPQIIKTLKTKSVDDISLAFLRICCCAYVLFLMGNILLGYWHFILSHVISAIGHFYLLYLVERYRNKK